MSVTWLSNFAIGVTSKRVVTAAVILVKNLNQNQSSRSVSKLLASVSAKTRIFTRTRRYICTMSDAMLFTRGN